jgi:hypothetical protein
MIGTLVGAGLSVIGGISGGIAGARAARKRRNALQAQEDDSRSLYDRRYNEDATQRADAQELLRLTSERMRAQNRDAAGTQAVMGGTDARTAQVMAANNSLYSDAVGRISAAAAGRKDAVEDRYEAERRGFAAQRAGLDAERAANTASATGKLAEAGGQLATGLEDALGEKKAGKNGSGFLGFTV